MNKDTDLTIVILSYNSQFWLKKTLETLKENYLDKTIFKVEVIVVDNASQDESVKMVRKSFKFAQLIESDENLGFAAGNNLALKKIKSKYVMLLNSDMEATAETKLDLLIDYMNQHPTVAVITPAVRLVNGSLDPACHRGEPTPWASLTYFAKLESLFPNVKLFSGYHQWYKNLSHIHPIDACSGAAMIVRTSAMKDVGLLDEQFFMYAEDLDWCKRFREAGGEIIFYPGVSIIHHKYKSGINSSSAALSKMTSH